MKALITGACGMVGREVVKHFDRLGWEVGIATSSTEVPSILEKFRKVPFQLSDVTENELLKSVLKNVDVLVHAAAVLPGSLGPNPKLFQLNVGGSHGLFTLAQAAGVGHVIFLSTANLFDPGLEWIDETSTPVPANDYALSKLIGEQMLSNYFALRGLKSTVLRISAPYGLGYRTRAVIPTFMEAALTGKDLELMGTGLREQTFTYTKDIARACELVVNKKATGIFNITGPGPTSMKSLAEIILLVTGTTTSKIVMSGKPDPLEKVRRNLSTKKAEVELGYVPKYELAEGLKELFTQMTRLR